MCGKKGVAQPLAKKVGRGADRPNLGHQRARATSCPKTQASCSHQTRPEAGHTQHGDTILGTVRLQKARGKYSYKGRGKGKWLSFAEG